MEVVFNNRKLQKICSSEKEMKRTYGTVCAKILARRLAQIQASDNLSDLALWPQVRLHELDGNRKGQLTVDLEHPYRLAFEPLEDPPPTKNDGGLDWEAVEGVVVIEIFDSH